MQNVKSVQPLLGPVNSVMTLVEDRAITAACHVRINSPWYLCKVAGSPFLHTADIRHIMTVSRLPPVAVRLQQRLSLEVLDLAVCGVAIS